MGEYRALQIFSSKAARYIAISAAFAIPLRANSVFSLKQPASHLPRHETVTLIGDKQTGDNVCHTPPNAPWWHASAFHTRKSFSPKMF
jgi:hypothetical protein